MLDLATAQEKTVRIMQHLAAGCHTILVAGSVRRERPQVKDFELVAVPIHLQTSLFGDPDWDAGTQLDAIIADLVARGALRWDMDQPRNGPRYKRLIVCSVNIPLDLFLTDRDTFGNILTIRTGDSDFSRLLVTPTTFNGLMPAGLHQQDGGLYRGKNLIPCPTEEAFFTALGIPVEAIPAPPERTAAVVPALRTIQAAVEKRREG